MGWRHFPLLLGGQVSTKTLLSKHALGAEACSFLPPSLRWHQEQPWVFRPWALLGASVSLPPNCAPLLAHGLCHGSGDAAAPVYCVCEELFTCFVCCHPASETRQTSKLTQENKVQCYPDSLCFPAPRSSPYKLLPPPSLFLKGGSRNCSKIGQLFIGLGEL